jgi:hypothetical protein
MKQTTTFKTLLLAFAVICTTTVTNAQSNLGVGTATPDASAKLDVTSTNQGILVPRMTTTARTAISAPAKGLMVYDSTIKAFYYHDGTAWGQVGGTSLPSQTGQSGKFLTTDGTNPSWVANIPGAKLELIAFKLDAIQTPPTANGFNTGDIITFNSMIVAPALGIYSSNTYTVGTGQGGLYYVQVRSVSVDNATPSSTTGHWFKIEIDPVGTGFPSFINSRDVYGPYPAASANNFPSGLKGRGELSAFIQLNAGDSFVIKGLTASSTTTNSIKNDGSCNLIIYKLN